jgi:hypothetical protein
MKQMISSRLAKRYILDGTASHYTTKNMIHKNYVTGSCNLQTERNVVRIRQMITKEDNFKNIDKVYIPSSRFTIDYTWMDIKHD